MSLGGASSSVDLSSSFSPSVSIVMTVSVVVVIFKSRPPISLGGAGVASVTIGSSMKPILAVVFDDVTSPAACR